MIRRWANAVRTNIRRLWVLPVRFYQAALSPWLGRQCRFQPTCSQYFIDAVMRRGIIVGTAKGLWRICRCNPWSKGGWNPAE